MGKRITAEQIGLANQFIIDGYSIPEAAQAAKMSVASVKKYCREAIASMLASIRSADSTSDNKIMIETQMEQDRLVAQELDDRQFISLLEYEFSKATTFEEARELYWVHKPQAIINISRVEAFRKIYEQTLNQVTGRPVPHNPNTNPPNQIDNNESEESINDDTTPSNKEIIKGYKARLNIPYSSTT